MFHREGYKIILITTIAIGISFIFIDKFVVDEVVNRVLSIVTLLIYLFILQQFRNSKRTINEHPEAFLSPVDGKLISIDTGEQIKLTFRVSPFNFHIVRAPYKGNIKTIGTEPITIKTSEVNEDSNWKIILESGKFSSKPVSYTNNNSSVLQGEEIGFIKFDAKVTIIIPKSSKLEVKINDRVKAGEHIIATI